MYALWRKSYYSVNFDPGTDASAKFSQKKVVVGQTIGFLPTAERWGYTLDGWFTKSTGGEQITELTPIYQDTTYYAHWTQITEPTPEEPEPEPEDPGEQPTPAVKAPLITTLDKLTPIAGSTRHIVTRWYSNLHDGAGLKHTYNGSNVNCQSYGWSYDAQQYRLNQDSSKIYVELNVLPGRDMSGISNSYSYIYQDTPIYQYAGHKFLCWYLMLVGSGDSHSFGKSAETEKVENAGTMNSGTWTPIFNTGTQVVKTYINFTDWAKRLYTENGSTYYGFSFFVLRDPIP